MCREGRSGNILWDFCNTHSGHRAGESYNTALVLSTIKNASLASIMIYNPTLIIGVHFLGVFFYPRIPIFHILDRSVNILKSHVATPSYYRRNQQMDSIQTSFKALFETSNFNFLNEFRPVFVTLKLLQHETGLKLRSLAVPFVDHRKINALYKRKQPFYLEASDSNNIVKRSKTDFF